jgi:hypothetical protein
MHERSRDSRGMAWSRSRARLVASALALAAVFMLAPSAVASAHDATLFRSLYTRLCLNSTRGGRVYAGNCNGANDWYSTYTTNGLGYLVDRHTGLCLEATHIHRGHVYTRKCGSSVYEAWLPLPVSRGNMYKNVGTGQCLVNGRTGSVYMSGCHSASDMKQQVKEHWAVLPGS